MKTTFEVSSKNFMLASGNKMGKTKAQNEYLLDILAELICAESFGESQAEEIFLRKMQERLEILGDQIKLTDAEKIKLAQCYARYEEFKKTKRGRIF